MVIQNYKKLVLSPKFIGYTIGGGLVTTSFYAFLSVISFIVVHQLKGTVHEVSLYLALIMVRVWLGCFASNRLVDKLSIDNMIVLGSRICIICYCIFHVYCFRLYQYI